MIIMRQELQAGRDKKILGLGSMFVLTGLITLLINETFVALQPSLSYIAGLLIIIGMIVSVSSVSSIGRIRQVSNVEGI